MLTTNAGSTDFTIDPSEMFYSRCGVGVKIDEVDGQVVITIRNTIKVPEIDIVTHDNDRLAQVVANHDGATIYYA